jgi:hypothetical protein
VIVMHEMTSTLEKVSDTNLTLVDLPASYVRPRHISKAGKPSAKGSLWSLSSLPPVGHKADLYQAKCSPPEGLTPDVEPWGGGSASDGASRALFRALKMPARRSRS